MPHSIISILRSKYHVRSWPGEALTEAVVLPEGGNVLGFLDA